MKRYNTATHTKTKNAKVDAFILDLLRVYKKHDMAISHEDPSQELVISGLDKGFVKYLQRAYDGTDESIQKNPKIKYKFIKKTKDNP